MDAHFADKPLHVLRLGCDPPAVEYFDGHLSVRVLHALAKKDLAIGALTYHVGEEILLINVLLNDIVLQSVYPLQIVCFLIQKYYLKNLASRSIKLEDITFLLATTLLLYSLRHL